MNKHPKQFPLSETIILYAADSADSSLVRFAEEKLQIDAVRHLPEVPSASCYLMADAGGLSLAEDGRLLRGDFAKILPRLIPNNLNHELLVKAARLKGVPGPLTAADATAGLGEDAILLAAAGFHVHLYERNPVIALLLYDALRRGMKHPDLAPVIERMELHTEDSIATLPQLTPAPDIIVLDPMFPGRQKSGLIKKKFQLLHQLEQPCSDEDALLRAAMPAAPEEL